MTIVNRCNNTRCACNDDGQCEYVWGVELDEDGECVSFIELEEKEGEESDS